jgi:hypothetical protein
MLIEAIDLPFSAIARLDTSAIWRVKIDESNSDDPSFTFHEISGNLDDLIEGRLPGISANSPVTASYGVLEVQDAFLHVRTPADALSFLGHYGPLSRNEKTFPVDVIRMSDFANYRKHHEDALLATSNAFGPSDPSAWAKQQEEYKEWSSPVDLAWTTADRWPTGDDTGFVGILLCTDVKECLRTAAFISRGKGYTWKRCAREKCGSLFVATPKKTTFCSRSCAQLQSSLKQYTQKREAAKKAAKRKAR